VRIVTHQELVISNMWEIAAMAEWPHGYPSFEALPSGLLPHAP
jgi:hypothetical protein